MTIKPAAPTIKTQVPAATERLAPTVTLTDTATLEGATTNAGATGTITFRLYGPFAGAPGAALHRGQAARATADGER